MIRWRTTIQHVKHYKQMSEQSPSIVNFLADETSKIPDEMSIVMNIYAEHLTRSRNGMEKERLINYFCCRVKHHFSSLFIFHRYFHFVTYRNGPKRRLSDFDGKLVHGVIGHPRNRFKLEDELIADNSSSRRH